MERFTAWPGPFAAWPGGTRLGAGATQRYRARIIDLATDEPADSWAEAAPETVLVVDGSFLQRTELREDRDEVNYLDVAFEVALARGLARPRLVRPEP